MRRLVHYRQYIKSALAAAGKVTVATSYVRRRYVVTLHYTVLCAVVCFIYVCVCAAALAVSI